MSGENAMESLHFADGVAGADDAETLFEQAILPVMPDLLAYFVRRVLPAEDSADCLSETMLVVWRKRGSLPQDDSERRAWAFGIARRVLGNYRRGSIRRNALSDLLRDEIRTTAGSALTEGRDLLSVLPASDRELVQLIIWDGFGVAEAGAILGIKPSAARMRYARAKDRIRRSLDAPGQATERLEELFQ
jgi:RNA polymerase sigma-70 factor (ECF subfamily)